MTSRKDHTVSTTEPAKAPATESEQWQFGINVPPVETLIRRYLHKSQLPDPVPPLAGCTPRCRPELVDADGEQVPVRVHATGPLTDEDRRHLADIVAAFRRKLTDTEPETAMPDTRFEPCSDERSHSPHQIDRGAFGRKTCPGVHADDADPQPATVAEPGPPVLRLCADGRPHQAHVNGVWRCPGVDTDARIQLEAEDDRVRELIIPTRWEIVARIAIPQAPEPEGDAIVVCEDGEVWQFDISSGEWMSDAGGGTKLSWPNLVACEAQEGRTLAVLRKVEPSDSPPPGGSGIARECTTHHACDCREAAYEQTADDRDRYKAWLQEANAALNAAGRSTYRDEAATLDLAERIKTLTTERDRARKSLREADNDLGEIGAALDAVNAPDPDGHRTLAERIKRLADERNEAQEVVGGAHRVLDEAGVTRRFELAERVQALCGAREIDSLAYTAMRSALNISDDADVVEAVREAVRERDELRADGVTHVHHHDTEDHAASYNEGYADAERHTWGELLGWVSDHMINGGEA